MYVIIDNTVTIDRMITTRAELQQMAKDNEERKRIHAIKGIVEMAHSRVLHAARNSQVPVYHFPVSDYQGHWGHNYPLRDTFLRTNMAEILEKLRELFPDCDISAKTLAIQNTLDGRTTYEAPGPQPAHSIGPYIVVDWA